MIYFLLIFGAAALFYVYCKKLYSYWSDRSVPQTNPPWILGDEWKMGSGVAHWSDVFQKIYDTNNDAKYIGYYTFCEPRILLKDPEIIKRITIKDFDHFVDHTQFTDTDNDQLWGRNLFAMEGQKWKNNRVMLTPSFTATKMKAMFSLVTECSKNFVKFFSDQQQDIFEINVNDAITRFTTDTIATTAFGVEVNSLVNPKNDFYKMGQTLVKMDLLRGLKMMMFQMSPRIYKYFKLQFFTEEMRKYYQELIRDIVKVRKENGIVRPDVIQLLIETQQAAAQNNNGNKNVDLTHDDMVAHALLFFLGGLDTISSALNNLIYALAVHQDVQDRLRNEILETKKQHNGNIPFDVLMQMKYLDMVVSEVIRMWSPMVQMNRKCTKSYVLEPALPGGKPVRLEKGTTLIIPAFNMQRDPKYFPDPLKFDPERFNEDKKSEINSYIYMPFGAGPRNCIGARFSLMEIKNFAVHLLSSFQVVITEKTKLPMKISTTSLSPRSLDLVLGLKKLET